MQRQSQYQGAERRQSQSQSQYQGEERRAQDSIFDDTTIVPSGGSSGMNTQERKDEQAERVRQEEDRHHDQR